MGPAKIKVVKTPIIQILSSLKSLCSNLIMSGITESLSGGEFKTLSYGQKLLFVVTWSVNRPQVKMLGKEITPKVRFLTLFTDLWKHFC